MSTEIVSAIHGIAPRSDELLQLGGDVERGRADQIEYDERLTAEGADWLQLQTDSGIDLRENGKLRWQDHLRPVIKASTGFAEAIDEAPVTRWFDTNTFYRRPTIVGELKFRPEIFEAEVGTPGTYISLVAPDSFAELCDNQAEVDPRENIRQLYKQLIRYLQQSGVREVLLEEYPANRQEFATRGSTAEYIHQLAKNSDNLRIGFLQPDSELNIGGAFWYAVLNGANTSRDDINLDDWSPNTLELLGAGRLVLTHTVDLERLPLKYAQEKVKHLGETTQLVRQKLEEIT